jgi:hypothetical protein
MSVDFFTTELHTEQSAPIVSSPSGTSVRYVASSLPPSYRISVSPTFEVTLHRGDGYWTVTDARTGIYGQGDDISAAIRDFLAAVSEHLDTLERQPSLSEELAWQLSYLRERVRR